MKVFVVCAGFSAPIFEPWEKDMNRLGHSLHYYDYRTALRKENKDINTIRKEIIKNAEKIKPDVLFVLKGDIDIANIIKQIKKQYKCPMIYRCWDDPHYSYEMQIWRDYRGDVIRQADFVFTGCEGVINHYKNRYDVPYVDVAYQYPREDVYYNRLNELTEEQKEYYSADVSFCGHAGYDLRKYKMPTMKYKRSDIFRFLISNHIDLKIWGRGWDNPTFSDLKPYWKGCLPWNEVSYPMSCSKINLNLYAAEGYGWLNARFLHILSSGGFLLTQYMRGIDKLFKIGKEFSVFYSKQNLLEKVEYYLEHDKERERIAQKGLEKVRKEYNTKRWTKQFLEAVKATVRP